MSQTSQEKQKTSEKKSEKVANQWKNATNLGIKVTN